ncbi:MAG: esterase, partial [Bacteroidaceae bacterium]|nr:esterase [Bacteroidaceae bacterium]
MKRLFVLTAVALFCVSGYAQQALWGGAQLVSPQVNADKTVTFRYRAPKAMSVQVTGDFLPTQKMKMPNGFEVDMPGRGDLVEKDGVWEYTTPAPLAPELYSYSFVVDGVTTTDPANVYVNRDVASITNLFLIDGNEKVDLYKVQKVAHGTVHKIWYHSDAEGKDRRLTVYTPAGYENGKQKYPVMYLLHGIGGDEEAWYTQGRSTQIFDNLIAQGKAVPMIVVMTNGNLAMEAAPGEGSEGFTVPTMGLPKTMEGSFEAAFPEIVSFIDKNFRTKTDKKNRAIAGLSMGGFHSLNISREYPTLFGYVGLFSAAIGVTDPNISPVYQNADEKLATQFNAKNRPALYYIAIGNTDFLFKSNTEYRQKLDALGYPYEYVETEGGHIWRNWRT